MSNAEMSALETPEPILANALAAPNHGIVGLDQLIDAGIASSTVRDWARRGHLHRVHRGVYSVVPRPLLSLEGRWLAAVRACGADAVLSHGAAGQLVGMIQRRHRLGLHVAVTDRSRRRIPGIILHRPRSLDPCDCTVRSGIPTTSPTRTLFDQASVVSPRTLRGQFEQAEYLELLDRPRLHALLRGATGRRGLRYLEELAGYASLPLSRTRSKRERLILTVCRSSGLPLPAVNVPLLDYEVDFLWPQARLVIEADGGQHVRERRARDNDRDLALQLAGYLVRRYSEEALVDEGAVGREIAAILRERLASVVLG